MHRDCLCPFELRSIAGLTRYCYPAPVYAVQKLTAAPPRKIPS
jgi:hypothetical protein